MKPFRPLACALALAALTLTPAQAQDWPAKPTRIVVPFPAGGPVDIIARLTAQQLTGKLGQAFVVENRPGAGGNIGTDLVAKSTPDGYTLVLSSSGPLANNRFLYKNMPFDAARDLTPIILIGEIPMIMVAHPQVPATNLKEFTELARSRPGQLNAASSGNGTISHLTLELFKSVAKVDLLHVPYKGGAPAMAEVLAGNVQVMFDPLTTHVKHVQAGNLRGLAVTTRTRFAGLPNVPTAIEQGVNIEASFWFALLGPAGLPRNVVDKVNQHVDAYLNSKEGTSKLAEFGGQVIGGAPARVTAMMESDSAKWKRIIESSGAKLD
jgi:tripartite-type tricarboxylate transporter receptor subunit TctC